MKHCIRGLALVALAAPVAAWSYTVIRADEYPDLATAADACPQDGARLVVPAGTYTIGRPVVLRSNVSMVGEGAVVLVNSMDGQQPMIVVQGTEVFHGFLRSDAHPGDRELDARGSTPFDPGDLVRVGSDPMPLERLTQVALVARATNGRIVTQDAIGTFLPSGLELQRLEPATNVLIENVTIQGAVRWAIAAQSVRALRIRNVRILEPHAGIWISHAERPLIENCLITGARYGIRLFACNRAQVLRTRLDLSWGPNIALTYSNHADISSNTIISTHEQLQHGFSGDGITVSSSYGNRLCENTITNVSCYGVWVVGVSSQNVISRNVVTNSYTSGIQVNGGRSNSITDNVFQDIPRSAGIALLRADRSLVQGNYITRVDRALVMLDTRGSMLVDNRGRTNRNRNNSPADRNRDAVEQNNAW